MADNYQVRYNDNTTLVIRSSETAGVHTPVTRPDRTLDHATFRVKTAFTGASVDDMVIAIRVLDLSATPPTQVGSTIWRNATTGLNLASPPSMVNLEIAGTTAGLATQTTLAGVLAACQASTPAGENHIGEVGRRTTLVTATFNRPADTTTYASGDLVANSTTAVSVVPMSFTVARVAAGSGMIRRIRIRKSGTSTTGASFRLHLYTALPLPSNGDNGVFLTNRAANYMGKLDVTIDQAFTDGASGNGVPVVGQEINFALESGQIIYGLIEVRGAYTPVSGEIFTVELEVLPN